MSMPGQTILSSISRMRFTGTRATTYEGLKAVRRTIGRDVYAASIKDLERLEKKARQQAAKREKEREARELAKLQAELAAIAAKEAAREAAREVARVARNAKKRAARAAARLAAETDPGFIRRIVIDQTTNLNAGARAEDLLEEVNPIWRELSERFMTEGSVRMLLIKDDGELIADEDENVVHKSSWENVYWTVIHPFLYPYVRSTIEELLTPSPDYIPPAHIAFVITTNKQVPAARMAQRFRDSESKFCLIDPLVALWKQMGENSESDASRKRCFQIMRRIESFRIQYPNGVPEENVEEVAKAAQRKIVIKDMFNNSFLEYNVKSTKTFSWTNTRENHVDVGSLALQGAAVKVSEEEFQKIYQEHLTAWEDKQERFLMEGGKDVRCIRSAKGAWRVSDPLFEAFEKVTNQLGLNEYGLDCIKHPELNAYVREACVVNAAPVRLSNETATGHKDLKAAYTQHQMTSYFQGFLGKIQQARRLNIASSEARAFLAKHLGIFRCRILSCENELLVKLGVPVEGLVTLPSPELLYFIDHGVTAEIVSGVFGSTWSATKEEMYDGLMEPIGNVKKPYAQFAGCLGHQSEEKAYRFHGSADWASHLKSLGYKTFDNRDGTITVYIPKDFFYARHHMFAFITSYTRINMLEAMSKFDVSNLCSVVLDGIYYTGDCPELSPEFRDKKAKEPKGFGLGWYSPSYVPDGFLPMLEDQKLLSNCILSGQGGCGKTWSVLTDKGFNDVLYVVPQHTLGIENAKQHGVQYTTIHRLIGVECKPWKTDHTEPNVCLIDEMTMIDAEWIEKALVMYPNTLFFVAGDAVRHQGKMIAFQTRSGKPGQFSRIFDGGLPIKYFKQDRRSLDDGLKQLKVILRSMMLQIYTDGEVNDARIMEMWVRKNYPVVPIADINFCPGDTVIAGTHRTNEMLLKRGIVSGYLSARNERSKEFVEGWKKRGSFTTHSYQGSTIRDGKVFVVVNDGFELAMIYTAVSRAVRSEQIVFTTV